MYPEFKDPNEEEFVVSIRRNDVGASFPSEIKEQVTRCKDCKMSRDSGYLCTLFRDDKGNFMSTVPNGFCSWVSKADDVKEPKAQETIKWVDSLGGIENAKVEWAIFESFSKVVDNIADRLGLCVEGCDAEDAETFIMGALDDLISVDEAKKKYIERYGERRYKEKYGD